MLKRGVKKGHLLLGVVFLLQCKPKSGRGDTSPACTANECNYDSLPPILGKGEATFAPQKSCYVDTERVNVTCKGDLRGPPYNLCTTGYWLYPFGPTCEDITMCNKTDVPKHGSILPDEAFFDLYERIYYSCHDNYSLVGPSEAVCESGGVWNPPTVPTCKADCLTPVLDNGSVSPDFPTVRNGEVITFKCSKNFTKIGLSVTTCRDGHFDPPKLPVCYADCPRLSETFHNGARTGDSAPYTHGDEVYYKCNSNFNLIGSTNIICQDGIWSDSEPVCKEEKMESKDVATVVLTVLGFTGGIVGLIWKKCKKNKDLAAEQRQDAAEQQRAATEQRRAATEQRRAEQRRDEQRRADLAAKQRQDERERESQERDLAQQRRDDLAQQRRDALERQRVALEQQQADASFCSFL